MIARWLLGLGLFALAGCARPTPDDPLVIAAWWIEDAARGVPRRPAELRLATPDPRLERLADWTAARPAPDVLRSRARRWPHLAQLLSTGQAVLAGDPDALVKPAPATPPDLLAVIDAENRDRRILTIQAATVMGCDRAGAAAWAAAVATARRAADVMP